MKVAALSVGLCGVLLALSVSADNKVLLQGEVAVGEAEQWSFSLSGESRQQVVDGSIQLGDRDFRIAKVSVHNLVGAQRVAEEGFEYLVFSSSYSDQKATGEPWVAAVAKHHCDTPYNSFLVVYSINSTDKLQGLAEVPYKTLTESVEYSDDSELYCFVASPPEEVPKT